jgi:hypothetical protein
MKKIFAVALTTLTLTSMIYAVGLENPLASQFKDIPSIVNWASSFILPISTLALVGIVIYAGFLKLTSAGNPDKEKQFMETLTSGIVGFILILSASLVISILGALLGIRLLGIAK